MTEDEYGRKGQPISLQVKAFALVMMFTGLSIGDVAKLPKTDVRGNQIVTNRKKTGKEVYVVVPDFVIAALNTAPHDSAKYFFWSGNGKLHTRASKWNERLQRLFVLAKIRLKPTEWTQKATRSKKAKAASLEGPRMVSEADPRWFRHTFAVRLLLEDSTFEEVAEVLGNTAEMCRKHYSNWDQRRQRRIEDRIKSVWANDPAFKRLSEP